MRRLPVVHHIFAAHQRYKLTTLARPLLPLPPPAPPQLFRDPHARARIEELEKALAIMTVRGGGMRETVGHSMKRGDGGVGGRLTCGHKEKAPVR